MCPYAHIHGNVCVDNELKFGNRICANSGDRHHVNRAWCMQIHPTLLIWVASDCGTGHFLCCWATDCKNSCYVCRPALTVSKANDTVWQRWMLNWWLSDGTVCLTGSAKLFCHTHCKTVWIIIDCNSSCVFTQNDLLPLSAHALLAKLGLLIACCWPLNNMWLLMREFVLKSKTAVVLLPSNKQRLVVYAG